MKRLKLLLPVMALLLCIGGCGDSDDEGTALDIQNYSEEQEGKVINISNDRLEFVMNADTTQFSVTNKATGQTWFSNPPTAEEDTLSSGVNKTVLSSTIVVKYSDSKGQDFTYDNYQYSIVNKNYSLEVTKDENGKDNGVKVLYTIGDIEKTYLAPRAITEERMDKFCAAMSASDAKKIKNFYRRVDINNLRATDNKDELLAQYPDLAETKVYVMRDGQTDSKLQMFQEVFEGAGYTAEEYEYDSSRINVSTETGKAAFNVAIYYRLEGDELVVDVPMEEIVYSSENPITYLTALPYFGAAGMDEQGYMFVPDGPGGIINFNNGKISQAAYYNQVYGYDIGLTRDAVVDDSKVSYPLIGMAKEGGSYLCAIESGSSYAIVEADVAGRMNGFNSVKFTYTMLHGEDMDISGKSDVTVRTYERELPKEKLSQRYMFIDSDDYVKMATKYREYLMKTYPTLSDSAKDELPFVVEMIGGVDNKDHVFGVPVTKDLPLTSYKAANNIMEELSESGVNNFTVKYTGWSNGGVHNSSMRKVKPTKKLGSKSSLKDFIAGAKEKNVDVYMDANFQFVYKNKLLFDGYSVNRDTSKFVSREIVKLSYYSPIYFAELAEEYEYYVARPSYVMGNIDSVRDYITGLGTSNISFGDISRQLCGDYNYKKHVSREEAMNMITDKYKELADSGSLIMANSDNFYNVPYADIITGSVLSNKKFNIVDETIPFYQIALHGIVDYTAESLNLSQDAGETFLKSAELGAGLYYTITDEPTSVLQDSKYTEYFATEYSLWKDEIVENYERFSKDFAGTFDEYIVNHEKVANNVYKTEFSGGLTVVVNYNYNPFRYEGTEIPARDYIVKGGTK